MFSGEFKRARQVDLGGSSRSESREERLEKARCERIARELARRRENSAMKVQSWWRSILSRKRARVEFRRGWDQNLVEVIKELKNPNQDPRSRFLRVLHLLRELVFFFRVDCDKKRVDRLGQLIRLMLKKDLWVNSLFKFWCDDELLKDQWVVNLRKYVAILVGRLGEFPHEKDSISFPINFIMGLFPDERNFVVLSSASDPERGTLRETYWSILKPVIFAHSKSAAIFQIIRSSISIFATSPGISLESRRKSIAALWTIAMKIVITEQEIQPDSSEPSAVSFFIRDLLTIPLLKRKLECWSMSSVWSLIISENIASSVVFELSKYSNDLPEWFFARDVSALMPDNLGDDSFFLPYPHTSYPTIGYFLGNLLRMFEKISSLSDKVKDEFVIVLHQLIEKSPKEVFPSKVSEEHLISLDIDYEDDSDSDDEFSGYTRLSGSHKSGKNIQPHPLVVAQLTCLSRLDFIEFLMQRLNFQAKKPTFIFAVSGIINLILFKWVQIQKDVLSTIASSGSLTRSLWTMISTNKTIITLQNSLPMMSVLSLFCKCYAFSLSLGDDVEFFNGNLVFQIEKVVEIVKFIKDFLFFYFWKSESEGRDLNSSSGVLNAASELFCQLNDRYSRKKFCSPHAWIMDQIDSSVFRQETIGALSSRASRVLEKLPFVIPFEYRVNLFYSFIERDKENVQNEAFNSFDQLQYLGSQHSGTFIQVHRRRVFDDAFENLYKIGMRKWKQRIQIEFVNEQGMIEQGIDGGGLFKEFLTNICQEAFDPNFGLFKETDANFLFPDPLSHAKVPNSLNKFCFLGMVLGKALYSNILIQPQFADFFLRKLLKKHNLVDDLSTLDLQMYENLMKLKHFSQEEIESLSLTFTVSSSEVDSIELKPNGRNILVSKSNLYEYIKLLSEFRLNRQIRDQSQAFLVGLSSVIDLQWLRMFSSQELQVLISGTHSIDLADWKANSVYSGYTADSIEIQWFWEILHEMSDEERAILLNFSTSCSRAPLLGFSSIVPRFCIQQSTSSGQESLPTSSTCVNLLKLPSYSSKEIMKSKLMYAIHSNAGFDLT